MEAEREDSEEAAQGPEADLTIWFGKHTHHEGE